MEAESEQAHRGHGCPPIGPNLVWTQLNLMWVNNVICIYLFIFQGGFWFLVCISVFWNVLGLTSLDGVAL